MELKDLLITPIYIILLSLVAYVIRPYVTTPATRKYFLPALWVRFFGAIMLGVIYQFYYDGGDTFNYFTHGSRWIWEAFLDDPVIGFKMLLMDGSKHAGDTFRYAQRIWYFGDPHSYAIVKISGAIDLLTFHTYTSTALFFAFFSFTGLWSFFSAVERKYPTSRYWLVIGILFFPSSILWGSGILKDTITLGALGWLSFSCIHIIDFDKRGVKYWVIGLLMLLLIYNVKSYIVICYLPMLFVWLYWKYQLRIRNALVKIMVAPVLITIFLAMGYLSLQQISSYSDKYSIDAIAERAAITAYDIRYGWGSRVSGDGGYDLGQLDGTWQSMIRLMPQAIVVSLFRPFIWEIKNPMMAIAAIESFLVLLFSVWVLINPKRIRNVLSDPFLVFCFAFAVLFAFAVGVSTYNFGTLMRYKIPLLPFYSVVLIASTTKKQTSVPLKARSYAYQP